jgi:hypothetical protein
VTPPEMSGMRTRGSCSLLKGCFIRGSKFLSRHGPSLFGRGAGISSHSLRVRRLSLEPKMNWQYAIMTDNRGSLIAVCLCCVYLHVGYTIFDCNINYASIRARALGLPSCAMPMSTSDQRTLIFFIPSLPP